MLNRISSSRNIAQTFITQPLQYQNNTGDELTQTMGTAGTTTDNYDANGNLVSSTGPSGTTTYTWDARNRLQSISAANGQNSTFLYDFAGNLVSESQSGPVVNLTRNFVLDDRTNPASISQSNGDQLSVLTARLIDQDLAVVHSDGQVEYALTDAVNTTVATADQNGKIVGTFFYEPFGQTTSGGSTYPFQFTGRLVVASGLYSYRTRYYDPVAGRFLSLDPMGVAGTGSLYAYVLDAPTQFTDPLGGQAGSAAADLPGTAAHGAGVGALGGACIKQYGNNINSCAPGTAANPGDLGWEPPGNNLPLCDAATHAGDEVHESEKQTSWLTRIADKIVAIASKVCGRE